MHGCHVNLEVAKAVDYLKLVKIPELVPFTSQNR